MHIASSSLDSKSQVVNAQKQGRPQFGSLNPTGFLSALESQPLAELVFKDIAAFNVPKIALARTWKERWDTATLELSNTGITLFSSLVLPWALRWPVNKISKVGVDALGREIPYAKLAKTETATKLARMGVSFGFFFPFATAFWAAPFFRNWLTLKRTQNANFESLIGFEGVKSKRPQRSLQEEMDYQKGTAWKVFASGVALGAASLLSFGYAAKIVQGGVKGKFAGEAKKHLKAILEDKGKKQWNSFFNLFDLKGKSANQIEGGPAQLIFWGMPAYLGWIHGARSDNERRERFLQSGNALFWFFAAPKLSNLFFGEPFKRLAGKPEYWSQKFQNSVRSNQLPGESFHDAFNNKVKNLSYDDIKEFTRKEVGKGNKAFKDDLIRLKNKKFAISSLAVPIGALALVQLINFRLTERKIKSKMAAAAATPVAQPVPPKMPYPSPVLSVGPFVNSFNRGYAYPNMFVANQAAGNLPYPPTI